MISAYEELTHTRSRLEKYQQIIISTAREALDIANASYEEGEIGNMELIEVKRTYQQARMNLLQTTLEYNQTLISLESSIGKELVWN